MPAKLLSRAGVVDNGHVPTFSVQLSAGIRHNIAPERQGEMR
jgi:hypothetical protein